jgi:hypothetical protein
MDTDDIISRSGWDYIFLELFDAYKETCNLHEITKNPKTKRSAHKIARSITSTFNRLVPLGHHSKVRWEQLKAKHFI